MDRPDSPDFGNAPDPAANASIIAAWPHDPPGRRLSVKRSQAIQLLERSKQVLAERYGVTRLALFGSTARDSAGSESDVDILVAFDGPATSGRYFGVQFYLEDVFACAVDLVTEKALRKELRPHVEREAIHV